MAMPNLIRCCVRCADCLAIAFVEVPSLRDCRANCAACGGTDSVEPMGQVAGARIGQTVQCAACDGRCTHAKGPACDCPCGGANHGSGAVITVWRDAGATPRAAMPTSDVALARASEWRQAADAMRACFRFLNAQRLDFCARQIGRRETKARMMRSHAGRMKCAAATLTIAHNWIRQHARDPAPTDCFLALPDVARGTGAVTP